MKKRVAVISLLCVLLLAVVSTILYSQQLPGPQEPSILAVIIGPVVESTQDATSVSKTYALKVENRLGRDIWNLTAQVIGQDNLGVVVHDGLVSVASVTDGTDVVSADTFFLTRDLLSTMSPSVILQWQINYFDVDGLHQEDLAIIPEMEVE